MTQKGKPLQNSRDDPEPSPELRGGQRFLVFGAHPDDETVGMGGTIAKLAKAGHSLFVVIYTKGEEGYADKKLKDTIADVRRREIEIVSGILGIKKYELLGKPDMGLRNDKETFRETIQMIRRFRPDAVFTHHKIDRHRDHVIASRLVTEAFWQAGEPVAMDLGNPWRPKVLYYYEEAHPFKFPSHIVDVSETYQAKTDAMNAYLSQLPVVPFVLRGMEGQAIARGTAIGAKFGEAFLRSSVTPRRELEF